MLVLFTMFDASDAIASMRTALAEAGASRDHIIARRLSEGEGDRTSRPATARDIFADPPASGSADATPLQRLVDVEAGLANVKDTADGIQEAQQTLLSAQAEQGEQLSKIHDQQAAIATGIAELVRRVNRVDAFSDSFARNDAGVRSSGRRVRFDLPHTELQPRDTETLPAPSARTGVPARSAFAPKDIISSLDSFYGHKEKTSEVLDPEELVRFCQWFDGVRWKLFTAGVDEAMQVQIIC